MAPSPMQRSRDRLVPVWIALAMVFSLFVGTGAGVLAWLGGQAPATAILTGGVAFGGTLTLAVLIINILNQ
jgi:hypothetical protein